MRISAPLLTVVGTVAGTAAAIVAYQATAATGSPVTKPTAVTSASPAPLTSRTWLPCERGWKVAGATCVRVKEKVVVVHDLPASAGAPAQSASVRAIPSGASRPARHGDHTTAGQADDQIESETEAQADDGAESASEDSGHEDVGDNG